MAGKKDERLEKLGQEIKQALGVTAENKGGLTVEEAGKIGGQMVKRLIEEGKASQ